jgi:Spx/MgsR family transcriptional regulator
LIHTLKKEEFSVNELLFLAYEKCSTCQKAKAWLESHQIPFTFRPIKEENPTAQELAEWYRRSGLPLKRFFNTSGLAYRSLGLKDKLANLSEEEQLELLASDGMLVKRPLLVETILCSPASRKKNGSLLCIWMLESRFPITSKRRTAAMSTKEEFIEIFKENITRPGADAMLDYLMNKSDFFTAPASARYHGSYAGGLCDHSVNVYHCLKDYLEREQVQDLYGLNYSDETIALVALLHDVCKIGCYQSSTRNVKGADGKWTSVPTYQFKDPMPYGHGEKSVYIVNGYLRLTREEAFAIRYHMGFSGKEDPGQVGNAFQMFPLAFCLSVADMEATYFLESEPQG